MISPGRWHERVPKDIGRNLAYRKAILLAARDDQNVQRGLIEACRSDIFFYTNTFVWQYNPKKIDHEVEPFITYDFQEEAVRKTLHRLYVEQRRVLWEKSREVGATWLALICDDWMARFHRRKKFLVISHSEMAVDRVDDSDSLFWKVKFINDWLPDWLKLGQTKRKLGFSYPSTNSNINGAATTERSGVGGRATGVLLDEFSKHRQDREILGQTADTGPCWFIGTHYGLDTAFYDLTQRPDMFKIVLHWSQHPEKAVGLYRSGTVGGHEVIDKQHAFPPDYQFVTDGSPLGGPFPGLRSPWYDAECEERANSRDVAMHLDINPSGSMSQTWNPMVVRSLIEKYCRPPIWEGDVLYDVDSGLPKGLVPRAGGPLKLWGAKPQSEGLGPVGKFGVACDLSHGTGATPSCLSIGNLVTGEKIGELATARLDPKEFAALAVAVCLMFKDEDGEPALLVWEIPGPGVTFQDQVVQFGYTKVWKRIRVDKLTQERTENIGWVASPKTKSKLLLDYRIAVTRGQFLNRSEIAMKETLKFRWNSDSTEDSAETVSKNDPSGARMNHSDRVIADAMLWMLMATPKREAEEAEEEKVNVNSLAGRREMRHDRERAGRLWVTNGRLR